MTLSEHDIGKCLNYIKTIIDVSYEKDIIIDPCAGKGDLLEPINTLSRYNFHYDINPTKARVKALDFSKVDYERFDKTILAGLWYDKVHAISYPSENDALSYIQKCEEFANTISFLIPKKYSSIVLVNYHHLFTADITNDTVLKIWQRKTSKH